MYCIIVSFLPYRMIPGIRHRALEVYYYYYYIMLLCEAYSYSRSYTLIPLTKTLVYINCRQHTIERIVGLTDSYKVI